MMNRYAADGGLAAGGSDSNPSRDLHALKNQTVTDTQSTANNVAFRKYCLHVSHVAQRGSSMQKTARAAM